MYEYVNNIAAKLNLEEVMAIAGEQIINLRKSTLETTLKLLGFPDVESAVEGKLDIDKGYRALGRIGHDLEDYINLANVISLDTEVDGIKINLPDTLDFSEFKYLCDSVKYKNDRDLFYIKDKNKILNSSREYVEDFELGMDKKIAPDQWDLYASQVNKVAKFFLQANYDLLKPEQKEGLEDLTQLSKEQIDDRTSEIIDTIDFSNAVDIEDRFEISESVNFIKKTENILDGEDAKSKSSELALLALQKAAMDTRNKKDKFRRKYQEIQERYVKSEEEINRIMGQNEQTKGEY